MTVFGTLFALLPGVLNSVASSTDTSNDHEDTNFENPTPLPPPRPKHWAKKVQSQNTSTKNDAGQECDKSKEAETSDEWYNSEPKLPLPLFKPTMQGQFVSSHLHPTPVGCRGTKIIVPYSNSETLSPFLPYDRSLSAQPISI